MVDQKITTQNREDLKLYRGLLFVTMFLYPIFGIVNIYLLPKAHEDLSILIQRIIFSVLIAFFLILSYKIEVIARKFYLIISSFVYLGISHLLFIGYLKGFYIDHLAGILMVYVGTSLVFRRHRHLNVYLVYVAFAISLVANLAPKTELSPVVISAIFISITLVLFVGINSKIRAEIRLRHNEANLTSLTENTSDMIWSIDFTYKILTANSMAKNVLGKIGIDAVPGKYLDISKYPDFNRADWMGYYQRALDGEIFKVVRYNPESGLTYEHSFYPIKNRFGKVKGTCVYSRDISIQVQKERNLIEAQKLSKIGSFSRNLKTGTYSWSDYMYELFQIPKDTDLSKLDMKKFIYKDDYETYHQFFQDSIQNKTEFSLKYRIIRFNKTIVPIQTNIIVKKNELGEVVEINGTIQDITEQNNAEILERKNIELKKEKELIELASKQHEQFLANMSHEIRTPMNAIVGVSNLLAHSVDYDSKTKTYIDAIKTNSRNLLRIINDVLDFSNINSGTFEIHQLNFELIDFMNSAFELISDECKEKGVELSLFIDEDVHNKLSGDVFRTTQILTNLLSNALKFTEQGKIVLAAEKSQTQTSSDVEWVDFKVIDTGIGIPEEKLERVFDTFFQFNNDSIKNAGTGLGLSIVKKITEALGGKVEIKSWENIGTEVVVSMPFKKIDKENEVYENFDHDLKILLVEDNHFNQLVAVDTIASWNDKIIVDVAENGQIALDMLKSNDYDLILMDIQMPIMNGHEATIAIRSTFVEPKKSIPIIAVTAHAFKEEIENCFQSGMNDYISKPYESEDLINKISKLITTKNLKNNFVSIEKNEKINIEQNVVNVDAILDFTKGKKERIIKMVEMFLQDTPVELDKMRRLYNDKNYTQLKTLAHSFKPKFTYLGMPALSEIAKKIEHLSADEKEIEEINILITELSNEVELAYDELNKFITNL